MNTSKTLTPAERCRRYRIEILIAGAAYVVVLVASIELIKQGLSGPTRILLAVSPMVPAALMIRAVFRKVTRMDELQRRIQTEAFAIAGAGTAFLGLTYSFLEGNAGFPAIDSWWAWLSLAVIFAVARMVLARRYL